MSVLADIAASTTTDIHCGPIWLRVLLCTLPEQMAHAQAMAFAAGAAESANEPEGAPLPPMTPDRVRRMQAGAHGVACAVVQAVAVAGPGDEPPTEWEPLKVVLADADEDPAAGKLAASTLDRKSPGCLMMAVSVAMHQLQSEAGVLRPFSETTSNSSG